MLVYIICRKPNLRQIIAKAKIKVRDHTFGFNIEVTRWLGVYLGKGLQISAYKDLSQEKVPQAEVRVRSIGSATGLALSL